MHDIVAHGIAMISVQAVAGQAVASIDPSRAVCILEDIGYISREALQ